MNDVFSNWYSRLVHFVFELTFFLTTQDIGIKSLPKSDMNFVNLSCFWCFHITKKIDLAAEKCFLCIKIREKILVNAWEALLSLVLAISSFLLEDLINFRNISRTHVTVECRCSQNSQFKFFFNKLNVYFNSMPFLTHLEFQICTVPPIWTKVHALNLIMFSYIMWRYISIWNF